MKTLSPFIPVFCAFVSALPVRAQVVELEQPKTHGGFFAFAFAPDGTIVAGGTGQVRYTLNSKADVGGGELILWDAKTGRIRRTLGKHDSSVDSVMFSADGAVLASASQDDGVVKIWDAKSGALRETLKLGGRFGRGPAGATWLCVLSADGKTLATVTETRKSLGTATVRESDRLAIWDTSTGKLRWELPNSNVRSLTFTDDGTTLLAYAENTEWSGLDDRVRAQRSDQHVVGWEAASGKELFRSDTGKSSPSMLTSLPSGRVVMLMSRKLIFIDGKTGETMKEIKSQTSPPFYCSGRFSPDQKRFVAAQPSGKAVDWFEVENGQRVATQEFKSDQIWHEVFSSDLKRMACERGHKPMVFTLEPVPVESR
jgi:WD40 repeat protein